MKIIAPTYRENRAYISEGNTIYLVIAPDEKYGDDPRVLQPCAIPHSCCPESSCTRVAHGDIVSLWGANFWVSALGARPMQLIHIASNEKAVR